MQATKRATFADFKKKALQNKEVQKEYDALKPLFDIKKELVLARVNKGLTQDEIAKKIGTSKSNVLRLESLNNSYIPNLATLMKYAEALEMKLDIGFKISFKNSFLFFTLPIRLKDNEMVIEAIITDIGYYGGIYKK